MTRSEINTNAFIGYPWKDINLQLHVSLQVLVLFHIFKRHFVAYVKFWISRVWTSISWEFQLWFVTRSTRRVPLVEQELPTIPEHLSSPPVFYCGSCYSIYSFMCMLCRSLFVFNGVRVTRSIVLCVCCVDRCLSFCPFSLFHCVFCSSSIYGFWLPYWYLQTILVEVWIFISICCSFKIKLYFIAVMFPYYTANVNIWISTDPGVFINTNLKLR